MRAVANVLVYGFGACLVDAAVLTFDGNPSSPGPQDGSGVWSGTPTATNWWNGTVNVAWNSAQPDSAVLGAGNGAAGTIVIAGTVTVAGITFAAPGSGTYLLTNGVIELASGATFTNSTNAVIHSRLSGSGFTKEGSGTLTLSPVTNNTFAGAVTINAGTLEVRGLQADGTIRSNVTINAGGRLLLTITNMIANQAVIQVNSGGVFDLNLGDTVGYITGDGLVTNSTASTRNCILGLGGGLTHVFGGQINGPLNLTVNGANAGAGVQVLTNANGFTGIASATNNGILRVTHPLALGSTGGITFVSGAAHTGRLELSGGIALAERITLLARTGGATPNLNPHAVNVDGTNTLASVLTLASGGTIWNLQADAGLLVISGGLSTDASAARTLRVGGAGEIELRSAFTNSGNIFDLTKTGSGRVTLTTNSGYNGTTYIEEGTLVLSATASITNSSGIVLSNAAILDVSAPGSFSLGAGRTISGFGTVVGDVVASGASRLMPGLDGIAGVLTFTNGLSMMPDMTNHFDLGASPSSGNDLIRSGGLLAADGVAVVNPLELLDTANPYTLLASSGTLSGNFATVRVANASYAGTLDTNTPGRIDIRFTSTARNLVWAGGDSNWNVNAAVTWNTNTEVFLQGDHVTFDDSAPSNQRIAIVGAVIPLSLTVSGSSNYTLQGMGRISGGTGLVKDGPGSLTVATSNDFSGEVVVSNGLFIAASPAALGATSGATTVKSGAALETSGLNLGGELVRIEGTGGGAGALRNSGADQQYTLRRLELTGPTIVDTAGRMEVRGDNGLANGQVGGLFTFTKTGSNVFAFTDTTANIGDIVIQAGQFSYANSTVINTGFAFTVHSGGIRMYQPANPFPRDITYTGGGNIQLNDGAQTCTVAGAVSLGSVITNDINAGEVLVFAGPVSGAGSLINTNAGTVVLRVGNTFAGGIQHLAGNLLLAQDEATGPGPLMMNSGTLASADATPRVVTNRFSVKGAISLGQTVGGTGMLTLKTDVDLSGTAIVFTVNAPAILDGVVTNGGLTKAGNATLLLTRANAYEQGTKIDEGAIALASNATLGSGSLLMSGGRITSADTGQRIFTNAIGIDAASFFGDIVATGALVFTGPVDFNNSSRDPSFDSYVRWEGTQGNGGINEKRGFGTLHITGNGDWTRGGPLELREGEIIFDGCVVSNADAVRVMCTVSGGVSRLVVTNGAELSSTNAASNLRIGYSPGGSPAATNRVDLAGTLRLVTSGSAGLVQIGTSSSRGILNLLAGGVLEVKDIQHVTNTSEVIFDGGRLAYKASTNNSMNGISLVVIRGGGAMFDTASFYDTINTRLQDGGGGGGLTKLGGGTLRLNGSNTFEGSVTVVTGVLVAGHAWALGTTNAGTVVQSGGTLALSNNVVLLEPVTAEGEGNASNYGAIRNEGGTNVLASALNLRAQTRITSISRDLILRGGVVNGTNSGGLVLNPTATGTAILVTNNPILLATGAVVFSHGPGIVQLAVGGNQFGTLRLAYSNTLRLGLSDALPTNAALEIGANAAGQAPHGFLDLNGWHQTIGVLGNSNGANAGVRSIYNGAPGTLSTISVGGGNASSEFDGEIKDAAGVVAVAKIGTGTQVLSGVHGYNGGTVIGGGRLTVNGLFNGTGSVLVASGATLGGTGQIAGVVTSAGTVAPGDGTGLMVVGGYAQTTGATLSIEIGGVTFDQLVSAGPVMLDGALNVTLANGYTGAVGDSFLILAGAGISGTFRSTNLPALAGARWIVDYNGSTVTLSITNAAPPASGYDLAAALITNGLAGYQDDADGDGYANLLEYVTGGSLTNPGLEARMQGARANGLLGLRFSRDTNAVDATLIVEGSSSNVNGATWLGVATNIGGSWGAATNVFSAGTNSPFAETVYDQTEGTNRFLRLRVTRP